MTAPVRWLSFMTWTLRLAHARVITAARLRNMPLDEVLSNVAEPPAVDRLTEQRILAEVEDVTEFWLRTTPATRTSCLPRALARYTLLRNAGVPVQLVLGLRSGSTDPIGHAWIELRGQPLMEREPLNYHETFRHGA